jgi:rhodanese-related sulfurtransferase
MMQTSDSNIYAVGDAVEVQHFVDGERVQIALGGPANRQGRLAAEHLCGRPGHYRGTQGTSIVGLFGMAAAMTGHSEKVLARAEIPHEKIYVHPGHHAGYYPGAQPISIKLLFCPQTGKVLGAQAVGWEGVDKRIDVLAMAIQAGMTVYDLEETELAYAPQFGAAKDPVNMAGFVAAGVLRGDQPIVHAQSLISAEDESSQTADQFVLDVRSPEEFAEGHIEGAVNISIDQLRQRLDEVPNDRRVVACCQRGMRGYLAARLLAQRGFEVVNLSGGWIIFCHVAMATSRP